MFREKTWADTGLNSSTDCDVALCSIKSLVKKEETSSSSAVVTAHALASRLGY